MGSDTTSFIPLVGLGTFRLKGQAVQQSVRKAILMGYRHIDTAAIYKNEEDIGLVLQELYSSKQCDISRSDLWITSKLSPYNMETPRSSLLRTLSALQTDYLDLYLIHWPGIARKPASSLLNKKFRLEAWVVLNQAKSEGLVRNIGVSNFTPGHIQELMDETEYGIKSMFVQMEIHPWYWRDALEIQDLFLEHNITITGYALLAEGKLLGDECSSVFDDIAAKRGITRTQVVLAWALTKNWTILVKSENETHLKQNLDVTTVKNRLTPGDCSIIDSVSTADEEEKRCWDPRIVT